MTEMRKITAVLPAKELEVAMKNSGLGLTDTLREVLEHSVRRAEEAELASRPLSGQVASDQ